MLSRRPTHPRCPFATVLLVTGLAACVASPAPRPADRTAPSPALATPGPSPASPAPSLPPHQPPRFGVRFPSTQAGAWMPQALSGGASPGPTPNAPPALPGAADTAFRFVAPAGVAVPMGGTVRLRLTDGCGPVYWGVLDPAAAAMTADGTLWPRRPGAALAFAEQDGKRRYLQVAVTAEHPPADRFGPPTGWTLEGGEDQLAVITGRSDLEALWRAHVAPAEAFAPRWAAHASPSPPVAPPPAIDFTRHAVVAVAMALRHDEGDPVLTHLDAAGVHLVVPSMTGTSLMARRRMMALYRVPALAAGTPITIVRPDPSLPLPVSAPGAVPSPPPPIRPATGPGRDCPPAWAWDGSPRDVSLDAAMGGTDAHGLPVPGTPLALPVGGSLWLVGRSTHGPLAWTVADPALATLTPDAHGIPVASAPADRSRPPDPSPSPGISSGATLVARAPGAIQVTASAGGAAARMLVAVAPSPEVAWRFGFFPGAGVPAAGVPAGTRVIADDAAWQSFWDHTFPALAGQAPPVDFATYAVVAWIEDRFTYGERGDPVVVGIAPGGREVHVVAPGAESHRAPPRHRRAVSLFLTGRLAPDAAVRITTLCGPAD